MKNCRICKSKLKKIINLGKIALVGNFSKSKIKHKKYSIILNYCLKCKHVQISEYLHPNLLFKNYLWETGISKSNIFLIKKLLISLKKYGIGKKSKILEIASNDGSFIQILKKKFKCFAIGVDPAQNLAKKARSKKISTINDYFSYELSKKIKRKFDKFEFIFARNVVAHVKSPNGIFRGVKNLLSNDGIFILEVPHLLNIFKENQYDNIFHEHIGFHSLKSIRDLCSFNGLKIFNVELIDSQGGSIRCYIKNKYSSLEISKKIKIIDNLEKKSKLFSSKNLNKFEKRIVQHKKSINKLITNLKKNNFRISVYGASGKGQALMQYAKINNKLIDNVFDKSRLKCGKYTPGTNIKVLEPKYISRKNIDYLVILSWNIKREIIKQEKKFLKDGGKFIIPFPKPRILN